MSLLFYIERYNVTPSTISVGLHRLYSNPHFPL